MNDKEFFKRVFKSCKSNKELTTIYNRIMGTNLSVDCIRKKANSLGYHIKNNIGTNDLRTKDHIDWIKANKDNYETSTELHKAYINHFNSNIKHASFIYILKDLIKSKYKIEYTDEETQWFKDNTLNYYSREQVRDAFNKQFNRNLTKEDINRKMGYMKIHCSKPPKVVKIKPPKVEKTKLIKRKVVLNKQNISMFPAEQQQWLRENVNKYCFYKDLYEAFQNVFNTQFTLKQLERYIHNHKLKLKKFFIYNEQERNWLYENYNSSLSYVELANEFEKQFNKKISASTLKGICNGKKIFKSKENYACNVPTLPIGTEKVFNGFIYIKISDQKGSKDKRAYHENWAAKHRYVWEKANGKIPDGYIICFKDGNRLNCDISNLYLATFSESGILRKNNVYGYEEYTDAYLEILRLEKELLQ